MSETPPQRDSWENRRRIPEEETPDQRVRRLERDRDRAQRTRTTTQQQQSTTTKKVYNTLKV